MTRRIKPRTALKAVNEKLAEEGKYLHATKGYRKISIAKSVASLITENMKRGYGWYPLARIRHEIRRAIEDDRIRTRNGDQPRPTEPCSDRSPEGEQVAHNVDSV